MKAVILAAGRGSRMEGRTEAQPKCLSMLAGKTLLDWQLDAMAAAGIADIGIVRGYLGGLLVRSGVAQFDNPRWMQTNMVVSLSCAASWLAAGDCIVSYSDIVYPGETVTRLVAASGDVVVAYDLDWLRLWRLRFADPLSDAETFRVDAGGRLTEIGGRATDAAQIMGQYMGLLRFSPRGWRIVDGYLSGLSPEIRDRLDMTALLRGLLARGVPITTVAVHGQWLEVDSGSDLELYERMVADQGGRLWPLRC